MRQPEQPRLGQKYGGVAVSRADLNGDDEDPWAPVGDEEEDDPFAAPVNDSEWDGSIVSRDSDDSKDLRDANGNEPAPDSRKLWQTHQKDQDKQRPAFESDEEEDQDDDSEFDASSESLPDPDIDMEDSDEKEDDSDTSSTTRSQQLSGRAQLKKLQKSDFSQVAAGLSSADDVKQGQAVKQQQLTYDRLLDTRIKLQKGITVSNELDIGSIADASAEEAIQKAEAAALALWSTIESFRSTMLFSSASDSSHKRRFKATDTATLGDLWSHSESVEETSRPRRRAVIDHWSSRTRASAPSQPRAKLLTESREPPLTSVLDEYLSKEATKLVASSTERDSGAVNGEPTTLSRFFVDSFYQSLLRDLIASRTNNPGFAALPSAVTSSASLPGKPVPINNQKNRRAVDTKASKGRKLRYTPHEKLVNFMAPEDRSTWTEGAKTEFFRSLFGGQAGIGSTFNEMDQDEEAAGSHSQAINGLNREEGALRLFRS